MKTICDKGRDHPSTLKTLEALGRQLPAAEGLAYLDRGLQRSRNAEDGTASQRLALAEAKAEALLALVRPREAVEQLSDLLAVEGPPHRLAALRSAIAKAHRALGDETEAKRLEE